MKIIDGLILLKKKFGYLNFDDLLTNMLEVYKNTVLISRDLVDGIKIQILCKEDYLMHFKPKSLFCWDYDQRKYICFFNGSDIKSSQIL